MIKILLVSENVFFTDLLAIAVKNDRNFLFQHCALKKSSFLQSLKSYEPTVIVFDVYSLTNDTLKRIKEIYNLSNNANSGLILQETDLFYLKVKELLDIGFKGLLSRELTYDKFIEGIKKLHEGDYYITNEIMQILLSYSNKKKTTKMSQNSEQALSEREIDVLQAICEGKTSKETSEILYLSPRTIQWHRANLMQKIGAKNTSHLIRFAIKNGYYQSTLNIID